MYCYYWDSTLDVWICRWNGRLEDLVLDSDEVRAARWVDLQQITAMTKEGTFWALRDSYMEILSAEIEKTADLRDRKLPDFCSS